MSFHAYTKPVDYVLPRAVSRSNFVFDSDLVAGNVRMLLDYRGGPVSSTFTGTDNALVIQTRLDRGLQSTGARAEWTGGNPFVTIGNKLASNATNTGIGLMLNQNAFLNADTDITVDVSAATEAGLAFRYGANSTSGPGGTGGTGKITVTVVPSTSSLGHLSAVKGFVVGQEDFDTYRTFKFTGTTPIVAGTTYTLRVVAAGSLYTIYVNGVLEGTFTSTTNQTSTVHGATVHGADTTARLDNFSVAASSSPVATTWTVRNYDGDILGTGSVTSGTLDIPDSILKQRSNLGPYGWYRLYLTGPNHNDGQWGTAYGDCTFMRVPTSSLPANGSLNQPNPLLSTDQGSDDIARGVMGMGTTRYFIGNAALAASTNIANMLPLVQGAQTWQTNTASAARPRNVMMSFPNGTIGNEANVTTIVAGLKDYVKIWECRNEPNFYQDATTWTTGEFAAFHTAVKAGDANAIVVGPGSVEFTDGGIAYFQEFLNAGGGASCEAFSFHPYNCYQGDLATMRYTLGHLLTKKAAAGKSAYDMWMTEQGYAWNYGGVVWPHYATRWTSLMYFAQSCITADKMRPETTAYWYDTPIGYDEFPMFWLNDAGPGPTTGPTRTMSAELYGKTFTSELDFGTYGRNLYVGGLWTNPSTGAKVVGIQASSYGANTVRLRTTGAGSFTLVDPWGNTSTLVASGGDITVPVAELPQWVRVPSGSTAALVAADWNWGANACLTGTPATTATTYTGLATLNNDIQESPYAMGTILNSSLQGFRATDEIFPRNVQITFANQAINRVVIQCYAPWQYLGTLVDFDLQTFDGSTWTTRKTWTGDLTKSFHFTSGVARCLVETFWQDQYIFDYQFPATVTCQGVRCVIRSTSYTAFDTVDTSNTGNNGQNGWGYHITIREIQAFNTSVITAGVATGTGSAYQATVALLTGSSSGTKISNLVPLTGANLADVDEFVVVDKSDTTMASSGTDKKIVFSEMVAAVVSRAPVREFSGTGAPNGVVTGSVGDRYWRTDGGAGTTLYVKESGTNTNTGWVGK